MNYEGEKFLLKLYQTLDKQEAVLHAEKRSGKNSKDKFEKLRKYLDRLQKQETILDGEHQELEKYIKNRYYDKYVIKPENIPSSYWKKHPDYIDEKRSEHIFRIIRDQKEKLEEWIDYLLKQRTYYPMWVRYWAFQGMLQLGDYDKDKNVYKKRSKGTISTFADLDAEALDKTIEVMMQYVKDKEIIDNKLEKLVSNGSFGQIYAYINWKLNVEQKKIISDNDGIWKKYTKGQEKEIINSLKRKRSGWCIATLRTTQEYLEYSDFEIYYTKDEEGNYTMPRLCIRTQGNEVSEIRGIGPEQNVEPEMLDVLDKKLDEFSNKEKYQMHLNDMKKLTEIIEKDKITPEEYTFLFEMDREMNCFGLTYDARIIDAKNKHKINDFEFAKKVITRDDDDFRHLEDALKYDKKCAMEFVDCNQYIYLRLTRDLQLDEDVAIKAVEKSSMILRMAPNGIKNNKTVALHAISIYPISITNVDPELLKDKDFIIEAIKTNPLAYDYLPEVLKNDPDIMKYKDLEAQNERV